MQKYGIDTRRYEEDGSLVIQKGEEIYKDPSKPENFTKGKPMM
jgi:hypothetical protein